METDLWILVFATHPDTATDLFHDQAQALTDPALRQIYLDYDRAHDLDPQDPGSTTLPGASSPRRKADTAPAISQDKSPAPPPRH